MEITLSIFSIPLNLSYSNGFFSVYLFKIGYNVSFTIVDFPELETPVIQHNKPNGIFIIFFKLLPLAPIISTNFPFPS